MEVKTFSEKYTDAFEGYKKAVEVQLPSKVEKEKKRSTNPVVPVLVADKLSWTALSKEQRKEIYEKLSKIGGKLMLLESNEKGKGLQKEAHDGTRGIVEAVKKSIKENE